MPDCTRDSSLFPRLFPRDSSLFPRLHLDRQAIQNSLSPRCCPRVLPQTLSPASPQPALRLRPALHATATEPVEDTAGGAGGGGGSGAEEAGRGVAEPSSTVQIGGRERRAPRVTGGAARDAAGGAAEVGDAGRPAEGSGTADVGPATRRREGLSADGAEAGAGDGRAVPPTEAGSSRDAAATPLPRAPLETQHSAVGAAAAAAGSAGVAGGAAWEDGAGEAGAEDAARARPRQGGRRGYDADAARRAVSNAGVAGDVTGGDGSGVEPSRCGRRVPLSWPAPVGAPTSGGLGSAQRRLRSEQAPLRAGSGQRRRPTQRVVSGGGCPPGHQGRLEYQGALQHQGTLHYQGALESSLRRLPPPGVTGAACPVSGVAGTGRRVAGGW